MSDGRDQAAPLLSHMPSSATSSSGASPPATDPAVATLFDSESARYDRAHDQPLGHTLRARLAVVTELLGDGPGDALDAGMGPGRLCAELEGRGWTPSGVDISERMVGLAAARLPHARERLVQGSLENLPFADSSFDAVAATGVLEYVKEPGAAVAELSRVMRPGALVVVSIPNMRSVPAVWQGRVWYPAVRLLKRALPNPRRESPYRRPTVLPLAALERMLVDAGLRATSVRHTSAMVVPTPLDRAVPRLATRLAERLEHRRTPFARVCATQIVVAARKPGVAAGTPPTTLGG